MLEKFRVAPADNPERTPREEARLKKDFAEADRLRLQVEALGYLIKDTPEGPQVTKH